MSSPDIKAKLSIRDQWARAHAIKAINEDWKQYLPLLPPGTAPPLRDATDLPSAPFPKMPFPPYPPPKPIIIDIGIVGAGIAGLFAAKVLDYLNQELFIKALGSGGHRGPTPTMDEFYTDHVAADKIPNMLLFKYQILESAGEERVGGRLFTYDFGGPPSSHDYYDVGAMRFPKNPIMDRTFDLFQKLGMKTVTDPEAIAVAPKGSIIPYYMVDGSSTPVEPWCYNDITKWGTYASIGAQSADSDPFKMSGDHAIPKEILRYSPGEVMDAAIKPLRDALRQDAGTVSPGTSGWDLLMEFDTYSTRQFLGEAGGIPPTTGIPPTPYNYETIQWLETFNGGTDWYDQAHSETVLESMDFEYSDDKPTDWYCILGGAQQLAKILESELRHKPLYNHRVTSIAASDYMQVDISASGPSGPLSFRYNGLLNTTTLGCLRHMDLTKAGLNYETTQAIRSLGYGAASKVAIKFKRAWWIHDLGDFSIKKGGLGHSDLNLRTCVYPSYNIYDPVDSTAVLLCSYTWQQDADRIGALTSSNPDHRQKVAEEEQLKTLLIRDLARMHRNPGMTDEKVFKLINDNYLDHHAYDWGHDPNTAGAFAFFRPQQFTHLWNRMIQPSGDVIIAGEAASPHHAWVVGALESVVHGLHSWMVMNQHHVPQLKVAADILAQGREGNPYVGLPPYMDVENRRISDWHAALGNLRRDQFFGKDISELAGLFAGMSSGDVPAATS